MTFLRKKFPFSRPKFLMVDLFLVIDHVFQIFNIFTLLNFLYDHFFTTKSRISQNNSLMTPFFTLFLLSRTSNNTTSQNNGGADGCMGRPHLESWGHQSPLGLRPCALQEALYKCIDTIQYKGNARTNGTEQRILS